MKEEEQVLGGRYRLLRPIGKGGMGTVWLAEDLRLGGKLRAVKAAKPRPEEREAFVTEARMLCGLEHPSLPQIVDYFPPSGEDGCAYLVMDYVAGDTLADRFARFGRRLPFADVRRYAVQLSEVLGYLHACDPPVVYRDLKPANVIIDGRDRAVLVDFGTARRYRPEAAADTAMLGTPGFAAPEQLRGEQSDARTDWYGLGATLFYLLSGGLYAIRAAAGGGTIRGALQPDVPRAFADLLERLLSPDPADRPASAQEVLAALAQSGPPPQPVAAAPSIRESPAREGDGRPSAVRVYAFLSAYPGAGATFVLLGLSETLRRARVPHAVVECPAGEAELYGRLDGPARMPRRAVFASPDGDGPAEPAWRRGSAAYYPARPDAASPAGPPVRTSGWLRRLGAPIVLLDVSSRWLQPGGDWPAWLVPAADRLYLVADPTPVKWSPARQERCRVLLDAAGAAGLEARWIANRDEPFSRRGEWLAQLPDRPAVCVPQLATAAVAEAVWRGEPVPHDGASAERLARAWDEEAGRIAAQAFSMNRVGVVQ